MNEAITECNVQAFSVNQCFFIDVTLKTLTEENRREQKRTEENRREQKRTEENRREQNRTEQNRTEEEDYCLPSFFILRIEPICVFQSPTHFSTIFTNVEQFHTNSMEE
jgi:DNA segregation ATPase FtsK/SpoIIIE-like protein